MAAAAKIHVRVAPGAPAARVVGRHGEGWKVRVASPAESGKANEAVLRLLADALELPRRSIELVSGHAARDKLVALSGISPGEIERRMAWAAGDQRRADA